ncbi:MAG: hypothetical protein QOF33_3391 [Thermomicrobiales bacterium]|nr:hypothetical protein [Thermomicrobiales bacterium]MEA2585306.1 hypothetical protein [Thermomicrobiales bacterium]
MVSRIECVTIDCANAQRLAAFWAGVLGYETHEDIEGWVVIRDPRGAGPMMGFQQVPEGKIIKNRVHVDTTQVDGAWQDEVGRLASLGATPVRYVDERPDEAHWIMEDPEGNEFCCVWHRTPTQGAS